MAEVETSRDGSVLTITLNRPDSYNALTTGMHAALHAALEEAANKTIRNVTATVLTWRLKAIIDGKR